MYGNMDKMIYQTESQLNGTAVHKNIDKKCYSMQNILSGIDVYCEKYNLIGKIDVYFNDKKILRERKKKIVKIYDGYIFQLYAQYFSLKEMGYDVKQLQLHSIDDNKTYKIELPNDNLEMFEKFEDTIEQIKLFNMDGFVQTNLEKCKKCIYEPACDRSLLVDA